MEGKGK